MSQQDLQRMAVFNQHDFVQYMRELIEDYPAPSKFRNQMYILEGVLITIFAFLWLEYTQMGGFFKSIYPIVLALIVVVTQYLAIETGMRWLYKRWKPHKVTVKEFWMISFAGAFLGYVMVFFNAQCPGIELFFPDIFYFYTEHPHPTPSRLSVFYKIILTPWAVSTFFIVQATLKRQLAQELESIRQINEALEKRNLESTGKKGSEDGGPSFLDDDNKNTAVDFEVPVTDGFINIAFSDIYYIAVTDHYCKLVFKKEDDLMKEMVRLSLKEAMEQLPDDLFAQVHRSYAVNLIHVKQIKKKGQSFQLFMDEIDDIVPASRHRAQGFLPKLRTILN